MVLQKRSRRQLVAGLLVGGVVLALCSVAFACTSYIGQQIVTFVGGSGGGANTAFGGDGNALTMGYCPGTNLPGVTAQYPAGNLSLNAAQADTVQVSLHSFACTTGATNNNKGNSTKGDNAGFALPQGWYDINFYGTAPAYTTETFGTFGGVSFFTGAGGAASGDCMDSAVSGVPLNGVHLGSISVDANGNGMTDVVVQPSDMMSLTQGPGAGEFGNICTANTNSTPLGGPQTPVEII